MTIYQNAQALAARLVEHGFGPIVWLGGRSHLVAEAFGWATRLSGPQSPVVVLDDPFTAADPELVEERWRAALDTFASAREAAKPLPVLLACGPAEQAVKVTVAWLETASKTAR